MDELSSLRRSRGKEKKEPYFGTYHHSTSTSSRKIRIVVKAMFADAFASLPLERDEELMILDVGCGLGFLSCVSAEFFKNSRITGIDTFKHTSLKRSSQEKAKENARILGFSDRIDFKKGNVFGYTPAEKFDIIVSNLVIHNFGKKRFEAYSRISSWAHAGSFFVIGDLFFSPESDIAELAKAFKMLKQIKPKSGFRQYGLLVMSKVSPKKK
jgi:cyclopropane fatty-acyl-phospholipid synthase-like methyltransferase